MKKILCLVLTLAISANLCCIAAHAEEEQAGAVLQEQNFMQERAVQSNDEIYVLCDGNNDAEKINDALGENALTKTNKRTVYLVGNCVLDASNPIVDGDTAYIIRPCANVIFDGTHCTSLTYDGSIVPEDTIYPKLFALSGWIGGLQNVKFKEINCIDDQNNPSFITFTDTTEDKTGTFIMKNNTVYDLHDTLEDENRHMVYSTAKKTIIENNSFYNMQVGALRMNRRLWYMPSKVEFKGNYFRNIYRTLGPENGGNYLFFMGGFSDFSNNTFEQCLGDKRIYIWMDINSQFNNNTFNTCSLVGDLSLRSGMVSGNTYYRCIFDKTQNDSVIDGKSVIIDGNIFDSCTINNMMLMACGNNGRISGNLVTNITVQNDIETALIYSYDDFAYISGNQITFSSKSKINTEIFYPIYAGQAIVTENFIDYPDLGLIGGSENSIVVNNIPNTYRPY